MDKSYKERFYKRKHTIGQKAQEKLFNIINNQRLKVKNTERYYYTSTRMAKIRKNGKTKGQ